LSKPTLESLGKGLRRERVEALIQNKFFKAMCELIEHAGRFSTGAYQTIHDLLTSQIHAAGYSDTEIWAAMSFRKGTVV
jgi:hypothetical protein